MKVKFKIECCLNVSAEDFKLLKLAKPADLVQTALMQSAKMSAVVERVSNDKS